MKKIILDLCGGTGAWSEPYRKRGYDVRLVTLPDDVRTWDAPKKVHGVLAAPPCTEFSFAKHYHGKGNYTHNFKEGLSIVDACLRIIQRCEPAWWCLENPRGYLRRFLWVPRWTFDPWQYGDMYQKKTDLWGDFNIPIPIHSQKPKGAIKFSLLKSKDIAPERFGELSRTERRAITPPRFAEAFFQENE